MSRASNNTINVDTGFGIEGGWKSTSTKTADYTITNGDEGTLFILADTVTANTTFDVDGTFPANGVFYTYNKSTEFVGGGASGEVVKLIIDDTTAHTYAPSYEGNGIERWSNTIAITGKLNRGNG